MRIKRKILYGRSVYWGHGKVSEVERLNKEKNFSEALNSLHQIRKTRRSFFGVLEEEPSSIDRSIYGKRKISRK